MKRLEITGLDKFNHTITKYTGCAADHLFMLNECNDNETRECQICGTKMTLRYAPGYENEPSVPINVDVFVK